MTHSTREPLDPDRPVSQPRRGFMTSIVVSSVAIAAPAGVAAAAGSADAQPAPAPVPPAGYQLFSAQEAATVEALVNAMCPADEFTPNGVDCGVSIYIDRQLAGAYGAGARRYGMGPWEAGTPQHGSQSPLPPREAFLQGLEAMQAWLQKKHGKGYDALAVAEASSALDAMGGASGDAPVAVKSWFGELMYPLFTQGCFADPIYGGNRGKVFWKLVGYPGLPAFHADDVVNFKGKLHPDAKDPKSIQDFS